MRPFWYFNVSVGSGDKNCAFQGCALIVLSLHTVGTENPYTPQLHPSGSNFHEHYSDIPQTPPRHPQTSSGNMTCQQVTTDTKGLCQTYSNSTCHCLGVSVGVCWRLLAYCVHCRCHGVVWGMSGGCLRDIWVVFIEIGGARMCLGYVGSQSLQYGTKTLLRCSPERQNFCHLTILGHWNIKMVAYKLSKNGWVMPFLVIFRLAREKLLVTVALDHPVAPLHCTVDITQKLFLLKLGNNWHRLQLTAINC